MDENIPVTPIPGPCGVVSALSASGLATNEFTFGNFDVIFYGHNVCWYISDVLLAAIRSSETDYTKYCVSWISS